jgi:glutamate-1-semialdehyde 2,1-aminomutase
MEMMAPVGPVYQAGTLSGNPLAMTAGIETLKVLSQSGIYSQLEAKASSLEMGMVKAASEVGINLYVSRVASLLTAFFTATAIIDYQSARQADAALFSRFFHRMLGEGIYWPPSQFEAAFISLAHGDKDIETTVRIFKKAFSSM